MDDNEGDNLDIEFKRYLQIMRPYLGQLLDQDVIEICKAWIQRLSNCKDSEKVLRNKYVFALCYQLAKGVLEEPFLHIPTNNELHPLTEDFDSDCSSNSMECLAINSEEEDNTKILFNNKKRTLTETDYLSQETDLYSESNNNFRNDNVSTRNHDNLSSRNHDTHLNNKQQTLFCYTCREVAKDSTNYSSQCDEYKNRANNLVMKLREIKTQNIILQNELDALREEFKKKSTENICESIKVDIATSGCCHAKDSSSTINSLKNKLNEVQMSKNNLIETINILQEKLDRLEHLKKHEMEEIQANHKIEIIKIKSTTRDENKAMYEKKIEEIKQNYEIIINNLEAKAIKEKQEIESQRDELVFEKEKIIKSKETEIVQMSAIIKDQKKQLNDVINKFLEKPHEDMHTENIRVKAEQLEKRLNKMEKSKTKCARLFEAKLAHLQREKHLAECSLQLQLVRQRTQVVNEVVDENQAELSTALNKLENKYKDVVANMQATAIQRRMQDQMALESILQAACGIRNEGYTNCSQGTNRSQFSSKTMQNQNRNGNLSFDSELSNLIHGFKVENVVGGNKSAGEDSVMAGYCLDGERMGELFERVYVPQKDIGDGPLKK